MKVLKLYTLALCLIGGQELKAQNWNHTHQDREVAVDVDSITRRGYTLIWINKDKDFNPALKKLLIEAHFKNYPRLAKIYNKNTRKDVTFVVDPDYKGVAATAGGIVRYSPAWFAKNPRDIDVVTHEIMHIVQAYPNETGPWWVTEGIADYARFVYGVDNAGANWALPDFKDTQKYTDAYRVTARFFFWIHKYVKKNFVKNLDTAMRNKTYSDDFWKNETGYTVDELWTKYSQNPKI